MARHEPEARGPEELRVRIAERGEAARGIVSLELRPVDPSQPLPAFEAGAHIDLSLPGALRRSYSLVNDPRERHRYVVAINRDPHSRGASVHIHDHLDAGSELTISAPRNHFALVEDADESLFIAGGIGITPMVNMVRRLAALGRPWRLFYAARSRASAAFLADLQALAGDRPERLVLHFDDEALAVPDVASLVAAQPAGTHLYCCGPEPMLAAFERAHEGRDPATKHLEYFAGVRAAEPGAGSEANAEGNGAYVVELVRSKRTLTVQPGQSILQVAMDAGVDVSFSCSEGVCGTCETQVLEGIPDHRDRVLSDGERAANKSMMICCSGCKGPRLVLDL